ncbi:MAG TPA: hypothetical protein VNF46_07880 [Gammaproteobacteria bacterium]|nr:hypothetical protein [Gammaproteobacteria bacterium]
MTFHYHWHLIGFSSSVANTVGMAAIYSMLDKIAQYAVGLMQTDEVSFFFGAIDIGNFSFRFNYGVANALRIMLIAPTNIKAVLQQQNFTP